MHCSSLFFAYFRLYCVCFGLTDTVPEILLDADFCLFLCFCQCCFLTSSLPWRHILLLLWRTIQLSLKVLLTIRQHQEHHFHCRQVCPRVDGNKYQTFLKTAVVAWQSLMLFTLKAVSALVGAWSELGKEGENMRVKWFQETVSDVKPNLWLHLIDSGSDPVKCWASLTLLLAWVECLVSYRIRNVQTDVYVNRATDCQTEWGEQVYFIVCISTYPSVMFWMVYVVNIEWDLDWN